MPAYRHIPSLTEYLLIAENRMSVEMYSKQAEGRWVHQVFESPDDVVDVGSVECSFRVADVYDKVELPASRSATDPCPHA